MNYSNYTILKSYLHPNGHLAIQIRYEDHFMLNQQNDSDLEKSINLNSEILVYRRINLNQILMWKTINPNFRNANPNENEAPSPNAKFQPSEEGWKDAMKLFSRWLE